MRARRRSSSPSGFPRATKSVVSIRFDVRLATNGHCVHTRQGNESQFQIMYEVPFYTPHIVLRECIIRLMKIRVYKVNTRV